MTDMVGSLQKQEPDVNSVSIGRGILPITCERIAMKKVLCLLVCVAAYVTLSGSAAYAETGADMKLPVVSGKGETSAHMAMDAYAGRYENLRQIDGKCPYDYKLVQLCLLLDTSNSMDGLINQAKSQLWRIVNELSRAHKRGEDIRLEVALYEYGNDNLSMTSGYIRQVTPFTEDLDWLSEALFSLQTKGGSEYCGHVIGSSLNRLRWNTSGEGLKMIFIAGNEPFNQGAINYEIACRWAAERDIVVNTIYCGDYRRGIETFWQRGADLGGGSYFAIDSDRVLKGISTPYDDDLIELNSKINKTYVPYGKQGKQNLSRQMEQDMNAAKQSSAVSAGRAATKGSKLYKASEWDLVDALEDKKITVDKLEKEYLPQELQDKSAKELENYVEKKKKERETVKKQIAELSRKRDAYVLKKEKEAVGGETLGSAILKNLRTQAQAKNFSFK